MVLSIIAAIECHFVHTDRLVIEHRCHINVGCLLEVNACEHIAIGIFVRCIMVNGIGKCFKVLSVGHQIRVSLRTRAVQPKRSSKWCECIWHLDHTLDERFHNLAPNCATRHSPCAKGDAVGSECAVESRCLQLYVAGIGIFGDTVVIEFSYARYGKHLVRHIHCTCAIHSHHHFRTAVVEVAHRNLSFAFTSVASWISAYLHAVDRLRQAVVGNHGIGFVEAGFATHNLHSLILTTEHKNTP